MKARIKMTRLILAIFTIMLLVTAVASAQLPAKNRLIVVTDIGNQTDDFMSMVRLML